MSTLQPPNNDSVIDALIDAARVQADAVAGDNARSEPTVASPLREAAGSRIGPYKLLQQIGVGGFGVVFMAEQEKPVVRRVALKIIKLGMDTRAVVARFEAERQALAMMDHPNIARVLDAGATETGRPYFVMELVRGDPITEYCDTNNLSTKDRLELFTQVCHAVQHAHQKGIIHRDIKPSNVLVTVADGKPIPKVIDFGIAKATSTKLTEKTLFTEHRALIGTPAYMSPEQAEMSGVDIDTRSDVYSLGVLLYELLTGTTPFDPQQLRSAAYGEIQRIIREVEPPKPSTRLSTLKETLAKVASHRHTEPSKLSALLRGDLDWIVMKAMEKDRTRRYETANGLAMDVMRHLAGEAVLAVPPSPGYRLRKFARKHRAALSAAAIMLALLTGGVVVSTWQAIRASRSEHAAIVAKDEEAKQRQLVEAQRDRAVRAEAEAQEARKRADIDAATAKAVSDFLTEDLLGQVGSDDQIEKGFPPDPNLSVKTALNRAAARIGDKFKDQPLVEATIRDTIGSGFGKLGEAGIAVPHLERALALREATLGPNDPQTLEILNRLGVAEDANGQTQRCFEISQTVYLRRKAVLGPSHKDTLQAMSNFAITHAKLERYDDAWKLCEEGLAIVETNYGRDAEPALPFIMAQGWIKQKQQDISASLALHLRHLELLRNRYGPKHPETIHPAINTAVVMNNSGDPAGAERLLVETLENARNVFGADHPETLWAVEKLADQLRGYAPQQARDLLEEHLPNARNMLGPRHPSTLQLMFMLARITGGTYPHRARSLLDDVYRGRMDTLGPDAEATREAQSELAAVCAALGESERARSLYDDLISHYAGSVGEEHEETLYARLGVAKTYLRDGQPALALPIVQEVLQPLKNRVGDKHDYTVKTLEALRDTLIALNKFEEALPVAEEFTQLLRERIGQDTLATSYALTQVIGILNQLKRFDDAIARVDTTLLDYRRRLGDDHEVTVNFARHAVQAYFNAGRAAESLPMAEDMVRRTIAKYGRTSDEYLMASVGLAQAYLTAGRREDWTRIVDETTEIIRAQPSRPDYVHLMMRSSQFNEIGGRFLEAAAIMEEIVTKEADRLGPDHPKVMELKGELADRYSVGGQFNRAASLQRAHLAYIRKTEHADSPTLASALASLGLSLLELKEFTEAETFIRECLPIRETKMPDDWRTFNAKVMLGRALFGQKKYAEAEPLLLAGYDGMKQRQETIHARFKVRLREASLALVQLYEATGNSEGVETWKTEAELWKDAEQYVRRQR